MKNAREDDDGGAGAGPAAKRAAAPSQRPGLRAINDSVLAQAQQDRTRAEIRASQPYKFGVVRGLINDDLLRQARDEIIREVHFTEKETDIYKVNQTGDLAGLLRLDQDELAKLQGLVRVREALYSPEFRNFLSYVTDSGPLSGSVQDLSINLYTRGCHLLTHDDVIGTRRVSYILYLTPPDEPWQPKWGGGLRLYPTVRPGTPEADFSVTIPPEWNQLAFFRVQPGHSFHDVEEVYVDKERLSISGWFHAPQPGEENYEPVTEEQAAADTNATLAQLTGQAAAEDHQPQPIFEAYPEAVPTESAVAETAVAETAAPGPGPAADPRMDEALEGRLDAEADAYLRPYINGAVLDRLATYRTTFGEESMVQIDDFLAPDFYRTLAEAIEVDDLAKLPRTEAEVPAPWLLSKPPHLRRYMYLAENAEAPASADAAAHVPLAQLRAVLRSPEFGRLLAALTYLRPTARYAEARRFRQGHDYTLATASPHDGNVLEAVLSVTPGSWADGVGGYDLVMMGDDEDDDTADDPAVYRQGGDSAVLLTALPLPNQLTLILRDPGLLRFIKYVSRNAAGSRWDVTATYITEGGDDDDGDDDDDDDDDEGSEADDVDVDEEADEGAVGNDDDE